MDLEDRAVDCIYDCVCVSPVMSCVQACSQGQAEWVMNIQWQDQRWLSEIQALECLDRRRRSSGTDGFRGMERPQPGCGVCLRFREGYWTHEYRKSICLWLNTERIESMNKTNPEPYQIQPFLFALFCIVLNRTIIIQINIENLFILHI